MATSDKSNRETYEPQSICGQISLKEFMLSVANEREQKYEARFVAIDKSLVDYSQAIKEALNIAAANARDALASANATVATLGANIETRIRSEMASAKEAVLKAEAQQEVRFQGVNEFRAQMADQQATLIRKSEVDLRFDATDKKIDAAIAELRSQLVLISELAQHQKGKEIGVANVFGGIVIILTLIMSGIAIAVSVLPLLRH